MTKQTIAAIAAANAHLAHTTIAPIAIPATKPAPKGRQHTWQMSKADRRARYAAQREFFAGPATDAQIARVIREGGTAFGGMLAFEAAEEFAAIMAKRNGKRFHRIVRGA